MLNLAGIQATVADHANRFGKPGKLDPKLITKGPVNPIPGMPSQDPEIAAHSQIGTDLTPPHVRQFLDPATIEHAATLAERLL